MTDMSSGEEKNGAADAASTLQSEAGEESAPGAEPAEPLPARPRRARSGRQVLGWLAALLVVVIAGVATSPFWASSVVPRLPWGRGAAPEASGNAALAARLEALEQRPPAATTGALARLQSQQEVLAQRLDRLDAAARQQRTSGDALQGLRQDVARLDGVTARFGDRLGALEAKTKMQASAAGSDAALLLALLELREAVAAGRPFAAEYQGFAALARGRPGLEAAAAPLASSAADGIASLVALRAELADLAGRLATAPPPPAGWWRQALVQVRSLVTIRRVGAPENGPDAAIARAQAALAGGDLAGAVTAVAVLSGADAEAARPWLQRARARLAVEAVLTRLQERLTARLGSAPAAAPTEGPPPAAPAKHGAPS